MARVLVQNPAEAVDALCEELTAFYSHFPDKGKDPHYILFREGRVIADSEEGSHELRVFGLSNVEIALTKIAVCLTAEAFGADMFAYVSEAWMATSPTTNPLEIPEEWRPADEPTREEVILILAGDRGGSRSEGMMKFHRDENGKWLSFERVDFAAQGGRLRATKYDLWPTA